MSEQRKEEIGRCLAMVISSAVMLPAAELLARAVGFDPQPVGLKVTYCWMGIALGWMALHRRVGRKTTIKTRGL